MACAVDAGAVPRRRARLLVRPAMGLAWGASLAALIALRVLDWDAGIDTWAFGNAWLGGLLALTGLSTTRRLPDNPVGWIFLAGGVGQTFAGATREWAVYATATHPGLPGASWAALMAGVAAQVGLFTLPLVLLHFPDGDLLGHRWRAARAFVIAAFVGTALLSVVVPGAFTEQLPGLVNPLGIPGLPVAALWGVGSVLTIGAVLLGGAAVIVRWRRASGRLRIALQWVSMTGALLAMLVSLEMTPLGDRLALLTWLDPVGVALFVGAIGVAVLRGHLWDLDVIVNVSLAYGLLTLLVGLVFVAVVVGADLLLDGAPVIWPVVAALGIVAVGLAPLRSGTQAVVDRMLYGQRRGPRQALAGLGRRAGRMPSETQLLQEAVEAVAAAHLRLDQVSVVTPTASATTGLARTDPLVLPLRVHGVEVGRLEIASRPGARLRGPSLDALRELADQLAPIVQTASTTETLNRMRRELFSAREEERRRLRRDLHDGLGPALAAVALQVQGAVALIDRQPSVVKEVLVLLNEEVSQILTEVRTIAHDLRPPVLDALGLAGAVRQLALAFDRPDPPAANRLEVAVEAPDNLGELPAAVEVTAYRMIGEALTNVARHANATQARISLRRTTTALEVGVDDNGRGMPVPARYGVGTLSLIERAQELGGECGIEPTPGGGTRVWAVLPIVDAPRAAQPAPLRPGGSALEP